MKFAIIGVGGIGGYLGARLAAAGHEVVFVARGAHAEAMRRDGLTLKSPQGDVHIAKPEVPDGPSGYRPVDAVFVCVKLWDVEAVAPTLRPFLREDTAVIPLQNGISACDILSKSLGSDHVLGGVARFSAAIESPGVIRHNTAFATILFGELDRRKSSRQDAVLAACLGAGIDAKVPDDIEVVMWEKFAYLAPLAGACCFAQASVDKVVKNPAERARLQSMLEEAVAVGRAKGVALDAELAKRNMQYALELNPGIKPSMLVDLENGRRLELDWLNGEIVRLGKALGVPTPANAEVYEALKSYAMGGAT
jgi:2-dehydropantoate 2-reductase